MLQYFGMLGMPHSWAVVAQAILLQLQKLGIDLSCKTTNNAYGIPEPLLKTLSGLPAEFIPHAIQGKPFPPEVIHAMADRNSAHTDVSLSYTIPPNLKKINANHRLAIYNYETTILPPGWADILNQDAELVLPSSTFTRDIFFENGIREEQMTVVPHGYDPTVFNPTISPAPLPEIEEGTFVFLMIAAPHWRKGHDVLLEAYISEFQHDEDVALIMKTSLSSKEAAGSHVFVDLDQLRQTLQAKYHHKQWPAIHIVTQKLRSLAHLYRAADVFVLPTRAECFSLTPLEATACKRPVITTAYGGHLDFLNHDNSYLIDYDMRLCPPEGQYWEYQRDALISEPRVEHLRALLRHVKDHYEEAEQKAALAYRQIAERYTWENVARQLLDLIQQRGWNV